MSMEAFAISQAVGHELSQREAARDAGPGLALLLILFVGSALLAIGTAMFFPITFAVVGAAGFALYAIGDYLTYAIFERVDWIFVVVFGAIAATALFFLFRLAVALEAGMANHWSYRIARHLWRSLAVFAVAFFLLTLAYQSAEIRAPLIWASVLTLVFQASFFVDTMRPSRAGMPIVAAGAGFLLLVGLAPMSIALHHYATVGVVEKFGTPADKQVLAARKTCGLTGPFDACQDKEALYASVNRWLLYHGPLPPPWILQRDVFGTPANPTAWSSFKDELRAFSDRGLPTGTVAERAAFNRELGQIVIRWSQTQDAFALADSRVIRTGTMHPPTFLRWIRAMSEPSVPTVGKPRGGVYTQAD